MKDHLKSDRLIRLIAKEIGVEPSRLGDEVSLFHDLGVAGLDGYDLLSAIGVEFDIDITQVPWPRYFGEEASYNPVTHLVRSVTGKPHHNGIIRLRVSDLKKTVEKGSWEEPARQ